MLADRRLQFIVGDPNWFMSSMTFGELSYGKLDEEGSEGDEAQSESTTPGGRREKKWTVVAKTGGLAPAKIIAGRLLAEQIPARAWQEGAGQAIGLTVGLLGTGYVEVPEEYVEDAERILRDSDPDFGEAEEQVDDYWDGDGEGLDEEGWSELPSED